jgi:hypothetical protein
MLALFALSALAPLLAASGSACADPAIVSVTQASMHRDGALRYYDMAIVVRNLGTVKPASSLLTSVEVWQDATKVGEVGLRTLAPSASETVHYQVKRAARGRMGSTRLRFVLTMHDPHGVPFTDCSTQNDVFRTTV